ncbi:MAG: hypothetical protein K6G63_05680 [Eubacterium sp.]|nr:hypothetical protein [Eubacterium sp.]
MSNLKKNVIKRIASIMLVGVVSCISPLSDLSTVPDSKAAETPKPTAASGKEYLSELKVAMGNTEREAIGELAYLEDRGYKYLESSKGVPANLNEDSGTSEFNLLKDGPKKRFVYLAYKTTTDPSEAITDMAVMNMNGGYSVEDYNLLMEQYMDKQIKPFLDNFICTLQEYRANYKKKESTLGHARANYMRLMMNKLKDDDTGKPVGDLLLKETKYEMGDVAYNKLSDEEKKEHADILTMLTQANGQATLAIESLLTKAADSSEKKDKKTKKVKTWIDRYKDITLEDLQDEIKTAHPEYTKTEQLKELDKKYYDDALKLLGEYDKENKKYMGWDSFREKISEYEDIKDEIEDKVEAANEKAEETSESINEVSNSTGNVVDDKIISVVVEINETRQVLSDVTMDMQTMAVCEYLDSIEYNEDEDIDTLYDFFLQSGEDMADRNGIRKLYPLIESLSAGQIAGLEFVSLMDLCSIAIADENTYKDVNALFDDSDPVSIYEKVDRGIYEKGAVALTNDALRAKAKSADMESEDGYKLGKLPIILWSLTAGCAVATAVTIGTFAKAQQNYTNEVSKSIRHLGMNSRETNKFVQKFNSRKIKLTKIVDYKSEWADVIVGTDMAPKESLGTEITLAPTALYKALAVGTAVLTVVMTGVSIAFTVMDLKKYYNVELTPIPKYIVDEVDITTEDRKGNKIVTKNQSAYYKVVECTRFEGGSKAEKINFEALGTNNDLNGDIGKQWLSLYTVKMEKGCPILADSLKYVKGSSSVPAGYEKGIHMFGSAPKAVCNLNNAEYLFVKEAPEIRLYFKTDSQTVEELLKKSDKSGNASAAGSIVAESSHKNTIIAGSIIILCAIAAFFLARKKKNQAN